MKWIIFLIALLLPVSVFGGAYLGEYEIDDYVTFSVSVHDPLSAAAADADAVPDYRIYEDETTTAIVTGSMAKLDDDNTTGYYSERVQITAESGFEAGKSYSVYVSAAYDSTTGVKAFMFKVKARTRIVY